MIKERGILSSIMVCENNICVSNEKIIECGFYLLRIIKQITLQCSEPIKILLI